MFKSTKSNNKNINLNSNAKKENKGLTLLKKRKKCI